MQCNFLTFSRLDGPIGFEGVDFVDHWKWLLQTDDMVNSNTGEFDPRHLFGMSNQDIFRWPSLVNGIHRNLLGLFVTTLEMPGIPMLLWGEEQQFNVLENLSSDYVFGRSPMASSRAWQLHGCYKLGAEVYINMPFDSANFTCHDDNVSLDHRDPSHPVRNILKRMYELRRMYPSLNDGYNLTTLSTQIRDVFLPGSGNISTPTGLWSVYRGREMGVQDFEGQGFGNQGVWLIFHNDDRTVDYDFDCTNSSAALISAFPIGTTVKNLFYPYDEYTLAGSNVTYGIEGSPELSGCLSNFTLAPWGFKAFVPKTKWSIPDPTITNVLPKHDARIESSVAANEPNTIPIEIHFSSPMDCDSVKNSLTFSSTTHHGQIPCMNTSTINCMTVHFDAPTLAGGIATTWIFSANLTNVYDGVHTFTVNNASARDGSHTNTVDRFMFRIGQNDNPIIFPATANYTRGVLQQNPEGDLYIVPKAPGAEKFRYSTNWGSSWSDWTDYTGQNHTIIPQPWSGTNQQQWTGEHVILNFWSAKTGSSDHVQHSDRGRDDLPPRRWPHVSLHGSWNQYGYDIGLPNTMKQDDDGLWNFYLMAEYPTELVVNVWGMNPDGSPDKSAAYGDVNGDYVLDWLPPDSLSANILNISEPPPHPYLGYRVVINDGNYNYRLEPAGSAGVQLAFGICFLIIPLITAISGVIIYRQVFYQVKFNENGHRVRKGFRSLTEKIDGIFSSRKLEAEKEAAGISSNPDLPIIIGSLAAAAETSKRRSVLIATIEYIIEDWDIKVKIGGLGVMASLMAKNLDHQDLYWVVPCVGDIEYPFDRPGEIMTVTVCGKVLEVEVQYHKVRNITYILLDAPIFRTQLKADPYPPRMDELDSAIFYSAWNSCIAQALVRCPVDIYHVNDYHGALAPLYILPRTIPICLSLHNAEFQGLWPLKTQKDMDEICKVFNLPENLVREFVQFGEVFNLLHCAASYLRKYQNGFGAVGVSKKYGTRTFARYPIFWGLNRIGALPNPNPADTAEWNKKSSLQEAQIVTIDEAVEAERGNFRRQAQKWAGLEEDPTVRLTYHFSPKCTNSSYRLSSSSSLVDGRNKKEWTSLPTYSSVSSTRIPKLEIMMKRYPTRVFSKPEFTPIPSFIHKGAEFALIPSRDEPFGLVAVEFGGSGALGVGANIGGLGQMPGQFLGRMQKP
jgi:alpha-1,3-glucan synthase